MTCPHTLSEGSVLGYCCAQKITALLTLLAKAQADLNGFVVEYHKLLNEPEYAGTREDWINRCMTAERKLSASPTSGG